MKQFLVGTTGDYAPMSLYNPSTQQYEGFDIELALELGVLLNASITFVPTSWPTLNDDLLSHKFDFALCGITITPQRQENFLFSKPYLHTGKTILCHKDNISRFTCFDDLKRHYNNVIFNPGGTNQAFATTELNMCQHTIHKNNQEIPDLIASKSADFMITETIEAAYYIKQNPLLAAPLINKPFTQNDFGILLNKNQTELLEQLNHALDILDESGFMYKLSQKFI